MYIRLIIVRLDKCEKEMSKRKKTLTSFSLFAFQDIITSVCGIIVLVTLILTLELSIRVTATKTGSALSKDNYDELKLAVGNAETRLNELRGKLDSERKVLGNIPWNLRQVTVEDLEREITENLNKIEELKTANETLSQKQTELHEELDKRETLVQVKRKQIDQLRDQIGSLETELDQVREEARSQGESTTIVYSSRDATRKPYLVDISGTEIKATLIDSSDRDSRTFQGKDCSDDFIGWAKTKNPSKYYYVFVIRPSGIETGNKIEYFLTDLGPFRFGIDLIAEDQNIEVE